ncbi:capsid assembly scaffolding protein Gp46 family protein [Enterococcus sp. AZ196]|uniref:capsid assembly scaffolding protein Gp46 family protein n=1 Tax=Enterococcus sp. AZ196 TaxID=2774659 RepID=UPI003D29BD8B
MSEFKAIESQEELDRIIQDRLTREREKFSDYDAIKTRNAELETQVGTLQTAIEESKTTAADYDKQLSELNTQVAGYETASLRTRIALQHGLPYDLADRLQGTDEASIKADAERLAGFVTQKPQVPPLKSTESPIEDEKNSAYKNLLNGLKLEGE